MGRGPRAPGSGAANGLCAVLPTSLRARQRAFEHGCQRAFEPANEPSSMAANEPSSPPTSLRAWLPTSLRARPNGGLCGTQQRQPCAAHRALPLRFRSARAPLGALGEGLRGGEDNQADTNKKPDLVAKNVTRSGMQISPVERRSTFWAIDIQRTGSRTNKSSPEGRNPCTWCNIDHPVSGLCEHGRSCGIWHQLASWLTSFLQVSIKLAHLDEHVP